MIHDLLLRLAGLLLLYPCSLGVVGAIVVGVLVLRRLGH